MDGDEPPQKDSQSAETGASTPPAAAASASASTTASAPSDDLTIAQAMHAMESLTVLFGFSAEAASEAIHHVTSTTTSESGGGRDLVAMCCEYILDHGLGIDSGGAIAPIDNCPHVIAKGEPSGHEPQSSGNEDTKACGCISVGAKDVPGDIFDVPCRYFQQIEEQQEQPQCKRATGGFKDDLEYSVAGGGRPTCPMGENWWCLQCGGIYCSRYVNGHGVKHFEDHQQGSNEQDLKQQHCVMIGLADLSVWCHICGSYLETHHNQRLTSILQRLQEIKFRDD